MTAPDAAGIEAALAAGLAAHPSFIYIAARKEGHIIECAGWGCQERLVAHRYGDLHATHRAHVAAALLPVVTQAQAEALREAARAVIPEQFRDDPELCPTIYDPWDVADWLHARADESGA